MDTDTIIKILTQASKHPYKTITQYNTQNKKVIGAIPYFAPVEIIHAAGMYPVELWGGTIDISRANKYYPAFYCSILLTLMELALKGDFDFLDGVIIPTTCDGLRNLEENWKYAKPNISVIALTQPVNRAIPAAQSYYVRELRRVGKELEDMSGKKIYDKNLYQSIVLYNKQKQVMQQFTQLANNHLDIITPTIRHYCFKAARTLPVEIHTELMQNLISNLKKLPPYTFKGKKIITTGIILDSLSLLNSLEKLNFAIVGDNVVSESVNFDTLAPNHIDPYVSLAKLFANRAYSSVLFDPNKERSAHIIDLVKKYEADGVLLAIIKFCEEEEFDYPILKDDLEKAHIPYLYLETNSQGAIDEQATTRLQAFSEMLD